MRELGRPGIDEEVKITRRKRVAMVTDRVVAGTLSNTIGRVARFIGRRLLGEFPDEALTGSYDDIPKQLEDMEGETTELLEEVAGKLEETFDSEDEALFQEIYEESTGSKLAEEERSTLGV